MKPPGDLFLYCDMKDLGADMVPTVLLSVFFTFFIFRPPAAAVVVADCIKKKRVLRFVAVSHCDYCYYYYYRCLRRRFLYKPLF